MNTDPEAKPVDHGVHRVHGINPSNGSTPPATPCTPCTLWLKVRGSRYEPDLGIKLGYARYLLLEIEV
jgi:hypothetical protein